MKIKRAIGSLSVSVRIEASAIRIIDVHYVPRDPPPTAFLEFTLFSVVKALGHGEAPLFNL